MHNMLARSIYGGGSNEYTFNDLFNDCGGIGIGMVMMSVLVIPLIIIALRNGYYFISGSLIIIYVTIRLCTRYFRVYLKNRHLLLTTDNSNNRHARYRIIKMRIESLKGDMEEEIKKRKTDNITKVYDAMANLYEETEKLQKSFSMLK